MPPNTQYDTTVCIKIAMGGPALSPYIRIYKFFQSQSVFYLLLLQDQHNTQPTSPPSRPVEEWMLICQHNTELQPNTDSQQDIDWTQAAQTYPNVEEAPSFISQQRQAAGQHIFTTSADPQNLQGKQLQVYTTIQQHYKAVNPPPLRMIISGTASTGKSYLNSLSATSSSTPALCCSTHWCGCLQCGWPYSSLPPQPTH